MLEQFDVFASLSDIHGITWKENDERIFRYRVGQKVPSIGRVSRITHNVAGYVNYGTKSFVIYIENKSGDETIWRIIEGFPVELTMNTDELKSTSR